MALILAIESSCDDTSASVCRDGVILSNLIANQKIHESFGGVVPELASRAHQQNIIPTVDTALKRANIHIKEIDAIAFTRGPGLIGSLLVGMSFAKGIALAQKIPMIEVNHMQAHVLANCINEPRPSFPFLCLTVSGGHTQIVLVKDYLEMEVLGSTIDDAAGEAFDKAGKMLGLGYPAGVWIDKKSVHGNPSKFVFNQPQIPDLNFSFSGLKTSILYFLNKEVKKNPHFIEENLDDLCASIQFTIVDILIKKIKKAAQLYKIKDIAIAGGVSANSELRKKLEILCATQGWNAFIPEFEFCTDNAGMIAYTAYHKFLKNDFVGQDITPLARYHF
jgi:N6-L-threonylcarbamoyladenine synthase